MAVGYIVSAKIARKVLTATNIKPDDWLDPYNGETVVVDGKTYIILQREMYFSPDDTSVDGWHIVYSPTKEEIYNPDSGDPLGFLKKIYDDFKKGLGKTLNIGEKAVNIILIGAIVIIIIALFVFRKDIAAKLK